MNGNLAGFAIVKKHRSADFDYSMEQFFVMKKYNRRGVGQEGAKLAFETFKGRWRITQTEKNYPAQAFWRKVIKQYTGNTHEESYDQDRRSVQSFSNL
ncbi:hypothetical protein J7I93_04820 [Bacillus sp. ISL-47]|nr:hypothetical protein [Bacillus sp. ISL-47]MBT2706502.1 hypothetical protein [Pseudomonas sp. ISL-84]